MIITLKCKDCEKQYEVQEGSDEHYASRYYRPSTKESIWLCVNCRPENVETIDYDEIDSIK